MPCLSRKSPSCIMWSLFSRERSRRDLFSGLSCSSSENIVLSGGEREEIK